MGHAYNSALSAVTIVHVLGLSSGRFLGFLSTDHRGNHRPALCRPSRRRRRDEWYDLRAAEQVLIFRSFQSTAIHKIGVTSGSGQERIAGARHDPTFPVEDFGYVQHLNHFYDIDLIKTSPRILPVSIVMHPPQAFIRSF